MEGKSRTALIHSDSPHMSESSSESSSRTPTGDRKRRRTREEVGAQQEILVDVSRLLEDWNTTKCSLQCKNGSICSAGNGPWGQYQRSHCHCPRGFAGIECQYEAEICGSNELVCLHGKSCTGTANAFTCTCPPTRKDCLPRSIDYCTLTGHIKVVEGDDTTLVPTFCVNDGVCRDRHGDRQEHGGCDCPPSFSGDYCELPSHELDTTILSPPINSSSSGDVSPNELAVILLIVASGLLVFALAIRLIRRRRARWLRGDDIVINIQGFRDEYEDSNTLFPGMSAAKFD